MMTSCKVNIVQKHYQQFHVFVTMVTFENPVVTLHYFCIVIAWGVDNKLKTQMLICIS